MRILADFAVLGLPPVPWKAPTVTRSGHSFPDRNLVAWKEYVREVAEDHRPEGPLYCGPTMIDLTFLRRTPPGHLDGQPWCPPVEWNPAKEAYTKRGGPTPDTTNLVKGTEDALEGIIFANDVQSSITIARRAYGPRQGVQVRVYAIEPGDFGHGEPVPG